MGTRWFTVLILVLASGLLVSGADNDCSFLQNPDEFLTNIQRMHSMRSDLTAHLATYVYEAQPDTYKYTADPASIPHKNFIDDYIFTKMASAGIQSAPLASDAEFLRRVTLDLTGRIPSAADVDAFVADTN